MSDEEAQALAVLINPALLRWARERASLSAEAVALRMEAAPELILAWERGTAAPSLAKLRRLATVYKRPLAFFFLPEIPHGFTTIHDYRTPPNSTRTAEYTPALAAAIRAAEERRLALLDMFEDPPPPFPMVASLADPAEDVAQRLREMLRVSLETQRETDAKGTLPLWIGAVEALDVLVFQAGGIEEGLMRGLSISEQPLPVILLNGGDTPRGRVFTLLHELAHVALRQGGALCVLAENQQIERFCNRVAAAVLMPADALLAEPLVRAWSGGEWTDAELAILSSRYGVSDEAILLRLVELGKAARSQYDAMKPTFDLRYQVVRDKKKERSGRVDFWRTFMRDRGRRFVREVMEAYHDERATITEATEALQVRSESLDKIERLIFSPTTRR